MEENKTTVLNLKQKSWIRRHPYFTFSTFVVLLSLIFVNNSNNTQTNSIQQPTTNTQNVYIGDEAYIGQGKFLAKDETIKGQLDKAIIAKDTYGISEMINNGDIFDLDKETKILVIDQSSWAFDKEVRILEGKYIGKTGWIDRDFVYKK
jgi:hypothetical protein